MWILGRSEATTPESFTKHKAQTASPKLRLLAKFNCSLKSDSLPPIDMSWGSPTCNYGTHLHSWWTTDCKSVAEAMLLLCLVVVSPGPQDSSIAWQITFSNCAARTGTTDTRHTIDDLYLTKIVVQWLAFFQHTALTRRGAGSCPCSIECPTVPLNVQLVEIVVNRIEIVTPCPGQVVFYKFICRDLVSQGDTCLWVEGNPDHVFVSQLSFFDLRWEKTCEQHPPAPWAKHESLMSWGGAGYNECSRFPKGWWKDSTYNNLGGRCLI